MRTTRELLEEAIALNFEDVAAHAAYADLLMEEGDPRGEYVQLRLFLEDENRPVAQLREARERAAELYRRHEEEWLGDLAPFLVNPNRSVPEPVAPNVEFTYRRGWVSELHVQEVHGAFLTVLADAPQVRMLQKLTLADLRRRDGFTSLAPLIGSPYLGAVKSFTLGDEESFAPVAVGTGVVDLLQAMPVITEINLLAQDVETERLFSLKLPRLRRLRVDFASDYPLGILGGNQSFGRLTHLLLDSHDTYFRWLAGGSGTAPVPASLRETELCGLVYTRCLSKLTHLRLRVGGLNDECCHAIAHSGMVRRLKWLDLRNGDITDAGAEALANCRDLTNLEWLDVGGNQLTPVGIGLLTSRDIRVQYDSQRGDEDPGGEVMWA
jgi:uncharacterized protein (TIGR02996 family)